MTRYDFMRSRLARGPSLKNSLIVVITAVGIATGLRWLVGAAADLVPFVTYFPAIVICALLAGWRAGLVSILASMTIVNLLFLKPRIEIAGDWQTGVMMGLFVLSCLALVATAQSLRNTVTKLQAANERSEYLKQELMHCVRNTLTVINSLAALTHQSDSANFMANFSKRMGALASGLDLLAEGPDGTCELRETIEQACQPFMHGERIRISGQSSTLPGEVCMPLVLAIHELCTNAVKYGAFSDPAGSLMIQLSVDEASKDSLLIWQEADGPSVSPPVREGLGSALLAHPLLGPAVLTFLPQGLRCEMRFKTAL